MLKIALGGRVGVRTLVLSKKKAGIHFSLFAIIGAMWNGNVGRCIPLRNKRITYIGISHDTSIRLYTVKASPWGERCHVSD